MSRHSREGSAECRSSSKDYNSEGTESEEELDAGEDQEMGCIPEPISSHIPYLDIPALVEEQLATNTQSPPQPTL